MEVHPLDQELVRESLAGDLQAFQALVERHQQAVFRILYRLLKNRQEAEDMAQETLLRCYRHLNKYDQARPFAPWLYRVATNLALSRMRRQAKQQSIPWENCDHRVTETQTASQGSHTANLPVLEGSSQGLDPEAAWEREETRAEVARALKSLKPQDRLIIILRYFEDLSYDEISYILHARRNSIEVRLFRARQKLRSMPLLQQQWEATQ